MSTPSLISQPFAGNVSSFAPRQPAVVLPSHSSFQPSFVSRVGERVRDVVELRACRRGRASAAARGPAVRMRMLRKRMVWPAFVASLPMLCTWSAMKPLRRQVVHDVGDRHAVHPRADRRADRLDAERVPLAHLERLARGLVPVERVQPASARLVVEAAGPRPVGRVDLHLVAVHAPVLDRRVCEAADLHAAVHRRSRASPRTRG